MKDYQDINVDLSRLEKQIEEDDYNRDFLKAADIVFLSDEGVQTSPEELIQGIYQLYHNKIIVMGCGSKGALLFEAETGKITMVPAVTTRPIVSTSGAGDALFSTFLHFYVKGDSPIDSLRKATYVASYPEEIEILKLIQHH